MALFKEKLMFSYAFADAFGTFRHNYNFQGKAHVFQCFCRYTFKDIVTLFENKLMFSDACVDTGDGNLCGCWPLSSSSRAPSEEDIPAQVRILGLLRQMQIWYRVFFYWSAPKSSKCQIT